MGIRFTKDSFQYSGFTAKVSSLFARMFQFSGIRKPYPNGLMLGFFVISFLLQVSAFGQFTYEQLTNAQGLSQGYVSSILQDGDGFLWVGTKDGLNRYDGYNFKVFTHDACDSNSISSNEITNLYEDSKGRLWVSTVDNGINVYDKLRNRFRRIQHDPSRVGGLSGNSITSAIVELPDGRMLVPSLPKGLNLVELPADFFEHDSPAAVENIATPLAGRVQHLFKDRHQRIWLIGDEKLYEYNYKNRSIIGRNQGGGYRENASNADGTFSPNDLPFGWYEGIDRFPVLLQELTNGNATTMYLDDNARLWVGITNLNKLLVFDIKNWKKGDQPLKVQDCLIFSDNAVTPTIMMKDRSGALWMGTNGYGLRKYTFESEKFNHTAKGLSIRKILVGPQNDLYVKDWADCKRTTTSGAPLAMESPILIKDAYDQFIAKNGDIWTTSIFANPQGARIKVIERKNPITKVYQSYTIDFDIMFATLGPWLEDHRGHIWIGGINGKFLILNPTTGQFRQYTIATDPANPMLPNSVMTTFYEDSDHTVWMGAQGGFVKILLHGPARDQLTVTWMRSIPNDKTALNSNQVSCFLDDPFDKNFLWICTKGGGLNRMNKTTGKFVHITTNEGLCNNVVYGILTDAVGNIWGSTNRGIFCMLLHSNKSYEPWEFRHFTQAAGLQSDEFNTGAYAKLPNGNLAFGGVNGLNIFNPKEILIDRFDPNIYITNLLIQNKVVLPNDRSGILQQSIEYTTSITLEPDQEVLTLEFSALDFRAPDQNKYRYQMVGIDQNWIESGSRRNVTYSHLPAGTYTFKVQGSNSLGNWGDKITELKVIILPPWWATWWAYCAYVLLLGVAIRAYLKHRLDQTKMEARLAFEQNEAKRIKELDTVKTQLYTNITHEFRTPLTVILGMAQQAKNDPKSQLENALDMIIRNGKNLLNLVNEMLDLSKIEAGKMQLNLIDGDVVQFLRYIVESFHSMAESQGKQMHYLASLDAMYTRYDAEKLRQIVANLLSNALKFTSEKGNIYVTIASSDLKTAENCQWLVIKIKDTGQGIPEDQLLHIFDRFYQVDASQTRKAEGTGIGLALTKELVQLMGGTIEVKSPPVGAKKGTEFTVTLPMNLLQDESQYAEIEHPQLQQPMPTRMGLHHPDLASPSSEINTSQNQLILLVEDNADVVAYTASCLPDYRLAVGNDGQEGFDIACEIIPDLIITDVMMPFVDGFEMSRRLRNDQRTSHIPIIMLTAKADMASKLEGLEHGVDAYLEKPFHKEELLLRIKKLLERRTELQQYYSQNLNAPPTNSVTPGTDITPSADQAEHAFVQKIRRLVEENLSDLDYNVDQLSKDLYMSHSQLHRKLDALIGIAPSRYIRTLRMNKAKELLLDQKHSITKIAFDCGYTTPSYFTRVFKQEFGITPQEWRSKEND